MNSHLAVLPLAQAIGFAFAFGALLLVLLTMLPATRHVARQLWPILGSEAAILAMGVLPWLLPPLALLGLLTLASARIGYESGTVHGMAAGKPLGFSYAVLLAAVCIAAWHASTAVLVWLILGLALAGLLGTLVTDGKSLAGSAARFAVFPLLPVAAFIHAAAHANLAPWLLLAFFLVEMFDSFSLLGGKLYGRTLLVPRLSPRKTWEGLATGIAATATALVLLTAWLGLEPVPMLVTGFLVVVAAMAGDLLGSAAKRRAGVKDYPPVMTIQGGLLDITDAWLVAGPCVAGMAVALGYAP